MMGVANQLHELAVQIMYSRLCSFV